MSFSKVSAKAPFSFKPPFELNRAVVRYRLKIIIRTALSCMHERFLRIPCLPPPSSSPARRSVLPEGGQEGEVGRTGGLRVRVGRTDALPSGCRVGMGGAAVLVAGRSRGGDILVGQDARDPRRGVGIRGALRRPAR